MAEGVHADARGSLMIASPVFCGRVRFAEVDGAVGEDGSHLYFADGGRLFLEGLGWRFGVFFEAGKSWVAACVWWRRLL